MDLVSFIIPTYNDTKNILSVIDATLRSSLNSETIIIDDGSMENHQSILSSITGINLITHPINKGKTHALKTGIEKSKGNVLTFIDADLDGLTSKNINDLVTPIIENSYDITLSKKGSGFSKLGGYGFTQAFTGERSFKKEIIVENIDMFDASKGYEIESEMNRRFFNKYKIGVVNWPNVANPPKLRHGLKGIKSDMKMYNQIREYLGVEELAKQIKFASDLPIIT